MAPDTLHEVAKIAERASGQGPPPPPPNLGSERVHLDPLGVVVPKIVMNPARGHADVGKPCPRRCLTQHKYAPR